MFIGKKYNPILRSLNEFFTCVFRTFRHDVPAVGPSLLLSNAVSKNVRFPRFLYGEFFSLFGNFCMFWEIACIFQHFLYVILKRPQKNTKDIPVDFLDGGGEKSCMIDNLDQFCANFLYVLPKWHCSAYRSIQGPSLLWGSLSTLRLGFTGCDNFCM